MHQPLRKYFYLGVCSTVLVINACSEQQPALAARPPVESPEAAPANPAGYQPETHMVMSLEQQITYSQQDLSVRLGITLDSLSTAEAKTVTWRSGALGCPEPGMNYTQALLPGVRIVLRAHNTSYQYHAAVGGQPFLCPQERIETVLPGMGTE